MDLLKKKPQIDFSTKKKFKSIISDDGKILKFSQNVEDQFANIKNIFELIPRKNEEKKLINTISKFSKDIDSKPIKVELALQINALYALYEITLYPKYLEKKLNTIEIIFVFKRIHDRFLFSENSKNLLKIQQKQNENIKKISKKICSIVRKELYLNNLFIFDNNNTFTISHWDIKSEKIANFINKEVLDIIDYLEKYLSYHYITNKVIDKFIDRIFQQSTPTFFNIKDLKSIINNFPFLFSKDPHTIYDKFFVLNNKLKIKYFSFVPVIYKQEKIGFFIVLKSETFTKIEKEYLSQINKKVLVELEQSEFITQFLTRKKDFNDYELQISNNMYFELYKAFLEVNKCDNLYELKTIISSNLRNLTQSDYITYYDIEKASKIFIPAFVNEDENKVKEIKEKKYPYHNEFAAELFQLKKPIILNYDYHCKDTTFDSFNFFKEKNKSFLFVPFVVEYKPIGFFILSKLNQKKYSEFNATMVTFFLDNTHVKMKEMLYIKENSGSKMKYKALYETILSLNTSKSVTNILDIIAKISSNLVATDTVVMYSLDEKTKTLSTIYSNERIDIRIKTFENKIKIGQFLIGKACEDGITRFQNIEEYNFELDSCPDKIPKSIMAIPLKIKEKVLGGMVLFRYISQHFTTEDLDTMTPFAQQAINIYYQNVLVEKNKEQKEIYKTLNETLIQLNTCDNVEEVFEIIAKQSTKLVYATKCYIYLTDGDNGLRPIYVLDREFFKKKIFSLKLKIGEGIVGLTAKTGEPIISNYNDDIKERIYLKKIDKEDYQLYSVLSIPLMNHDKIKGVMMLIKMDRAIFSSDDLEKILPFVNQVTNVIYTGNVEEQLRVTKKKYTAFINTMNDLLVHIDHDLSYEVMNDNFEKVFKLPLSQVKSNNFVDLICKEERALFLEKHSQWLKNGPEPNYRFKSCNSNNNSNIFLEMDMYYNKDKNNNFLEAYAIIKNVDDITILENQLNEKELLLRNSQKKTIKTFATLLAAKDDDTGNHLARIEGYTKILCEEMSKYPEYIDYFQKNSIENIADASVLHDVGKISIKDAILLKPGNLSSDEWEIMKTHTKFGYKILHVANKGIKYPYLLLAESIALHHHEKWDGTGYPDGLKGEEIPLEARIVSVVDVYDALRVKRPYKIAKSHDESCEIIYSLSGKHFDPKIVEIFKSINERFNIVNNQYKDEETIFAKNVIDKAEENNNQ